MRIQETHEKNHHGRPQLTLYTLRRTNWIPGGLSVMKGVLYRCKPCIRFDAKLLQPQMGDLLRERVVPSFAFSHCGLDYCGPLKLKWNSNAFENIRCNFHLLQYEGSSHRVSYISAQG